MSTAASGQLPEADAYEPQAARAESLIDLGRHDQAMETLIRLLRDFPDRAGATWKLLVLAHGAADRGEEATEAARRAVALLPQDAHAHLLLGGCLLDTKDPASAEPCLRTALSLDPTSHVAWTLLSLVLTRTGRAEEGFQAGCEALRLAPSEADAHHAVGRSLHESNPLEAERAYLEALRLDPELTSALAGLVGTRLSRNDEVGAARAASSLAALEPGHPAVHLLIDALLARTVSGFHKVTLLGTLVLLVALGVSVRSGSSGAVALLVLMFTLVLALLTAYRRARPLHDTLPHGGRSLAWSMLRRRRRVALWAGVLVALWLALAGGTVTTLLTGEVTPLALVALVGLVTGFAASLLATRDFRELLTG